MKFLNNMTKIVATVYMKSGNCIVLDNLKVLSVTKSGSQVDSIKWEMYGNKTKILNLNVDQIEAIVTQLKFRWV